MRLYVLVMIAAMAWLFVAAERRHLDDPVEQGRRGEITPASTQSFLRATRLQQALDAVTAAAPGATIASLRITPIQVMATVHHPDGREDRITVDAALEPSRTASGARPGKGISASKIPVAVPNRLVSLAVSRLDLHPEHLDYLLLSVFDVPGREQIVNWGLYYSDPPLDNDAVANLDGTDLRKMGQPDAEARAAQRKAQRSADRARADARKALAAMRDRREATGR